MSAPLVINLRDGSVWERRAVSRAGVALYALAGTCACPEFVMASEPELAELGIAGSADALPVPVGPEPKAADGFRVVVNVWNADDRTDAEWAAELATNALEGQGFKAHATVDEGEPDVAALRARVAALEALTTQATEFRLWEPGYGLYVRRAPGATGYGVMEARRTHAGRRVWTTAGWQYSAALSDAELFCWPDAQTAVAEARRIMPGTTVREDADDAPHEGPQHHTYRLGRDLPEAGEPS